MARIDISGSTVNIVDLKIESAEFARFLAGQEDPQGTVESLLILAFELRTQFVGNSESRAIHSALADVEKKLELAYAEFSERFTVELANLVDPENGPLRKGVDNAASTSLRKLLNPEIANDFDPSPIARLKEQLLEQIQASIQIEIVRPLELISRKLRVSDGERKATAAGDDFEAEVDSQIRAIAKVYGDHAVSTGASAQVGTSKKGDTIVTLNAEDTFGQERVVIWESKTARSFKSVSKTKSIAKLDAVRKELRSAIGNRGADIAVMVMDSSELDMNQQAEWHELDSKSLLLVVDEFNPNPELIRLAYIWSRSKSRALASTAVVEVDQATFDAAVTAIVQKLKNVTEAKKQNSAAKTSIDKSSALLDSMQKDIEASISSLRDSLNLPSTPAGEIDSE